MTARGRGRLARGRICDPVHLGAGGRRPARVASGVVLVLILASTGCGTRVDRSSLLYPGGGPTGEPTDGANPTAAPSSSVGPVPTSSTTAIPTSGPTGSAPNVPPYYSRLSRTDVGATIRIGLHVPQTGAAPLPTNWRDSLGAIQDYINTEARPFGRKVEFLVEDDGYDPSAGLAACKKIAGENPIVVVGHTMPAVQDACAALFGSRNVPYMMRGISETVLRNRPLAYFGTISGDRQARLLADYIMRVLNGKTRKVAILNENDEPSFKTIFVDRMKADGGSTAIAENVPPRQPNYSALIEKLNASKVDVVVMKMAPVDAIKIAIEGEQRGYHPTWMGPGSSFNYNMTLEAAGMAMDGSISFSAWCSIDSSAADQFKMVMKKYRPNSDYQNDDIGLIMWGWIGLIRAALTKAGPQLSVASFVGALDSLSHTSSSWNPIVYSVPDHRGASSVVVLQADGHAKRWRQATGFRSSF